MLRFDLHTHSKYSPDSSLEIKDILATAAVRGLHGVCVSDHNTLEGSLAAEALAAKEGIIVVRGTEVSTKEGHVLAYGIQQEVPNGLSATEAVELVHEQGGLSVAAHPYRFWSGLKEEVIREVSFDCLEALNSRSVVVHNERAQKLARELELPVTAGSDAHSLADVGRAVVLLPDGLEIGDEVLEALHRGEGRAAGASRDSAGTARYVTKAVGEWILRGFRKI